jgi:oxygen-independent coproporphyrinogen-3 oxidase
MNSLSAWLARGPYQAYAYAYPHKTAYRTLDPPVALDALWDGEERGALFGYVHVPFCTYRCGFCNLFALGSPEESLVEAYVERVLEQIDVMGRALGEHRFARFALGGGTPSYLPPRALERLLAAVTRHWRLDLAHVPAGIEVSPETATRERLGVCRQAGIDRVSMGVQSFVDAELRALARPAQRQAVIDAVETIRALGFPTLNLDLIYGIQGQSLASFERSIDSALAFQPEEIYLYPLYVRALTGLGRRAARAADDDAHATPRDDARLTMYCAARDRLRAAGYTQVSMRMFRAPHASEQGGPAYCCQNDGMVGVGCGARSYTRALHYSDRFGVSRANVSDILREYVAAPREQLAFARHGFRLDGFEQRRRFVIQSLLAWPGLDSLAYRARFGNDIEADFPELAELRDHGLVTHDSTLLALNDEGMAHADIIGPWLNSAAVSELMATHALA